MNETIQRSIERAQQDASASTAGSAAGAPRGVAKPTRRLAVGDPQAPLEKFFAVLHAHGLLGEDGRLRGDVQLVSMGDHFDWGKGADRDRATREGLQLLAWLAAHPPEQVVLLVGNHDISRVCELAGLDEAAYLRARAEAEQVYPDGPPEAERAFLERHPYVASAEALARDLSTFHVEQRRLVAKLLEQRRLRLAHAVAGDLLLVHGAVTHDDLDRLGLDRREHANAPAIAQLLNGFLDRVVESWDGREPLDLEPVHQHQSAKTGEGRGVLFQRPAHPEKADPAEFDGPPRRRYDPRRLPRGLSQGVGHIRDEKCRELLGPWVKDPEQPEGQLRHLATDGREAAYAYGVPAGRTPKHEARVLFLDGGMYWTEADRYELFDLTTRQPARK